ncbi:type I toxin-antitoxin system Fst family toxin [Staphylococcus caeli]|nr:type I toxin-antitoxin system Fst family toxin [Staphylococcus caeli]
MMLMCFVHILMTVISSCIIAYFSYWLNRRDK